MGAPLTETQLDTILALQLTVAWAGEGRCEPKRLGWWETDLVDEAGGGDFFARLLPQTHAWASFEAVREAARRVDLGARSKMASADKLRTPFFLGFETDERVDDRLAALKRGGKAPSAVLPMPIAQLGGATVFSRDQLVAALRVDDAGFTLVPGGRQMKGACPDAPDVAVRRLASALLDASERYPLPFYKHDA
jgi:hypothetical protein